MMHEHTVTYDPSPYSDLPSDKIIESVDAKIDAIADKAVGAIVSVVARHDHPDSERPHHHPIEELNGTTQDTGTPVPPAEPPPVPKKSGIWWGDNV